MWKYSLSIGIAIPMLIKIFWENLDKISEIATIIATCAVVIAYLEYRSRKEKERTLSVVGQLHFFRTEVLDYFETIVDEAKKRNFSEEFWISASINNSISDFSYKEVYNQHRQQMKQQSKLSKEKEIKKLIIKLLNSMEEFSWDVSLNKTTQEPALYVVHDSFIQFVEQFTDQILFRKGINPKQYEGIKNIYAVWAPTVTRESDEEKLARMTS